MKFAGTSGAFEGQEPELQSDTDEMTVSLDDFGSLHSSIPYALVPVGKTVRVGDRIWVGMSTWIVEDCEPEIIFIKQEVSR